MRDTEIVQAKHVIERHRMNYSTHRREKTNSEDFHTERSSRTTTITTRTRPWKNETKRRRCGGFKSCFTWRAAQR